MYKLLPIPIKFLAILLILTACTSSTPDPNVEHAPAPQISIDNYPALDGSTSTGPVLAMISCHFLEVPCTWLELFDGDRHLVPDLTDFTDQFPGYQVSGTHQAYLNLIDGEVDLILAAREPSKDEILYAAKSGAMLEAKPAALDAFVFIVNDNNPVEQLTSVQIQEIYSGKLTNWSELGGNDARIQPYQRNDTSGSQVLMRELVMDELPMIDAPDMSLPTMMAPFNAVSTDPNGIGYSVFYYEENMAPQQERIKLVAVDGERPDRGSIHDRQYPYTTEVFVVIRKDLLQDTVAFQLRNWLLSAAGQELIRESGYVPIN